MARRTKRTKHNKNKWRIILIIGFWIAVLSTIVLFDLKPWQYQNSATTSKEWPFKDLTKGEYATSFDGIDISRHQGRIHWEEIKKNESLTFVYIKATEGSNIVDPFYKDNVREAHRHGLKVGAYHFLTRRTSMKKQVENFLNTIVPEEQDLLPVVDIENDGTQGWDRPIIQKNLAEFIRLVKEQTGKSPMIYTNEAYYHLNLYPTFNRYHLFIANYSQEPTMIDTHYDIWQSSKHARVHGIWNWTDINHLRKGVTLDDLSW